jgi:hypothetical protein
MQAVSKNIITVLMLIMVCTGCSTLRDNFTGTFYNKYAMYIGTIYKFSTNNFKRTSTGDLGITTKWRGTYRIEDDTLILNYIPLKDPDPSLYKFIKRKPVNGTSDGTVQFLVVDKAGKPLIRTEMVTRNVSQKILNGYVADSLGYFPKLPVKKKVNDYHFFNLGRKQITIPADTLQGYNSKVKVILSDSLTQYSGYSGTNKYLIKKAKRDKIILRSIPKHRRIVLVRDDSE